MPCILDFILVGCEHKPTSQAMPCPKCAMPLTPYSYSQDYLYTCGVGSVES